MPNSIPSDRYEANKRFVVDVYPVSQHSRKPMLPIVVLRPPVKAV